MAKRNPEMIKSIGMRKRNMALARKYSMKVVPVRGSAGADQGWRKRSCRLYPCTKTSSNMEMNDQNLNFELVKGERILSAIGFPVEFHLSESLQGPGEQHRIPE
jgi:hypothetical protein